MKKLSIIVPVYNSEKYLDQCIQSILNQTYKNIELVLVDDESNDTSGKICTRYAEKDKRVVYIRESNAGTATARNNGLKNASGDYITFVDNDDFLSDHEAYEKIMALLNESNADILMFNTCKYDNKTGQYSHVDGNVDRYNIVGAKAADALKCIMSSKLMSVTVWSKVFKADMLKQYDIKFPDGMRNEDTAFTADAIIHAKTYDWYNGIFYCYRVNSNDSQTSKPMNSHQLNDLKKILIHYIKVADQINDSDLKEAVYSYLAFPFAVWTGYATIVKNVNEHDFKTMKTYSYVLKYHDDISMRKLSYIYYSDLRLQNWL